MLSPASEIKLGEDMFRKLRGTTMPQSRNQTALAVRKIRLLAASAHLSLYRSDTRAVAAVTRRIKLKRRPPRRAREK